MSTAAAILARPSRTARYAVVDLELTGLDVERDAICEVGVVVLDGGVEVTSWASLVRPPVPVSAGARRVHGIPDADLAVAPAVAEVLPGLAALLDGAVLVGHHVWFDRLFLARAFASCGLCLPELPVLDTLEAARRLFALRSHRLGAVCEALGVPRARLHRALDDARATAGLLERLLALLDADGTQTVGEVLGCLDALAVGGPLRAAQLDALRRAQGDRRTVRITYLSRDEERGGYVVTLREVQVWRLVPPRMQGWCLMRGAERVFRLERILHVESAEGSFAVPPFQARI